MTKNNSQEHVENSLCLLKLLSVTTILIWLFDSCSVKDVRPGLVFKQSTKRQFQLEEQHRSANEKVRKLNKPVRVLEAEKRDEGLSTAITSQNKGITNNL